MTRTTAIGGLLILVASCARPETPVEPASGKVISVDMNARELVLDIGKRHGVSEGMTFVIEFAQGGRSMPDARVVRVEGSRSVTTYPGVYMIPVQVGDRAVQLTGKHEE